MASGYAQGIGNGFAFEFSQGAYVFFGRGRFKTCPYFGFFDFRFFYGYGDGERLRGRCLHALHEIGFEFFDVFGDFEYCPIEQVAVGFRRCFAREDGQIRGFCHPGCGEVLREVGGGYVSGFG